MTHINPTLYFIHCWLLVSVGFCKIWCVSSCQTLINWKLQAICDLWLFVFVLTLTCPHLVILKRLGTWCLYNFIVLDKAMISSCGQAAGHTQRFSKKGNKPQGHWGQTLSACTLLSLLYKEKGEVQGEFHSVFFYVVCVVLLRSLWSFFFPHS